MVEHQIVNMILETGKLDILKNNGIPVEYFPEDYQPEVEFILNHYNQFGKVPDKLTFLDHFNDFEFITVNEPENYLVDQLIEKYVHKRQTLMANEWGQLLAGPDSREAFSYLTRTTEDIRKALLKKKKGSDITKDTTRAEQYENRRGMNGIIGLKTGMDDMDNATKGWLGEDLVIILARTNEGKSWMLLYFLYVAWLNGHSVLLYSGEMSKDVVGYRFDTIAGNFSNDGLMSGKDNLGGNGVNITPEQYKAFVDGLATNETPFTVVTPKDLGGRLDIPNLQFLIEVHQPDIIGVDQISLMRDYRAKRGDPLRIQHEHIAEDLYGLSEKFQKPILAPAQANRDSAKKKGEDEERLPPQLEELSESDGVGRNATRVIGMAVNGVVLSLAVRKNRYGKKDMEMKYLWDIDRGIIKPFNRPNNEQKTIEVETPKDEEPQVVNEEPKTTAGQELF